MKIISIEGNIGSGKTTLFSVLKNKLDPNIYIFINEPVDIWLSIKDKQGENILEKFYKDQYKYSFSFQMMAYISRLHIIKKTIKENPNKIIIIERSCLTDKNVFAKMLYNDDKIEEICYKIYLMWFDEFLEDIAINKFIYLNTQASICFDRIQKRSRGGENNIQSEYLDRCHNYHIDWLSQVSNKLELNGNIEFIDNNDILNDYINKIIDFIN